MKRCNWNGESWGMYSGGYWRIGARYLHREKWIALRGPIPKGWVVHHKDHNKSNCNISNLECLPRSTHSRHHLSDVLHTKPVWAKAAKTRSKMSAQIGKAISRAQLKKPQLPIICVQCKQQFLTRSKVAKLCSTRCRSNHRYQTRGRERVNNV